MHVSQRIQKSLQLNGQENRSAAVPKPVILGNTRELGEGTAADEDGGVYQTAWTSGHEQEAVIIQAAFGVLPPRTGVCTQTGALSLPLVIGETTRNRVLSAD